MWKNIQLRLNIKLCDVSMANIFLWGGQQGATENHQAPVVCEGFIQIFMHIPRSCSLYSSQ